MPKVAAEIAAPLSKTKKVTMVADGSGDIGAAKLTNEVMDIMNTIPASVHKMTGVDIARQMATAPASRV